jgi:3-hydroxy-9,10-secoandrosta-1,3,5(10)-triene-9,17-dione monooxygenase reductase component
MQSTHPTDALSPARLRRAFGRFATGVTIVTCMAEDGTWVGLTVNSFGSLSLDPPLVHWSLRCDSGYLEAFSGATHFAVNVLAASQVALSRRFASAGADRFVGDTWSRGAGGSALLAGSAAQIECERVSQHAFGDHLMFVGRVLRVAQTPAAPLVFHAGGYHLLGATAPAA